MNRLAGKCTYVTGGAAVIGRACAIRMAEQGSKAAIFDVLVVEGRTQASELTANGHDVGIWPVDVSDETALKSAIDTTAARFGGLQVMVYNAGMSGSPKPTDEVSQAEWDRLQAENVEGVFFGTKHAIPHLGAARGEVIFNLSSIAGLIGVGGTAPCHASKGAVRLMSKSDAITYAPEKIRVNSIHPACIRTPMVEDHPRANAPDLEAATAAAGAAHPIGNMDESDDITWAVIWLASNEAKFVTGAEIVIAGGHMAL